MTDGIYTALSGAMAEAKRMEMLSHNLANVSTSGFKKFKTSMNSVKGEAQASELTFVQIGSMEIDATGGKLRSTGNPLDVALAEGVFLALNDGGTEAYVHSTTMAVRGDGTLVAGNGVPVYGKKDTINISPDAAEIVIGADGSVNVDGSTVDNLRLVEFGNQSALVKGSGGTIVDGGDAERIIASSARPVMTGYIEDSNISALKGMTELISAHRSYEAAVRSIQTHGEMEKRAARDIAGRI